MGIFLVALILFLIPLVWAPSSFARHGQILGVSAQTERPDLLLSQGPGLILPNSPFYFLDLWRDNLNLLLASFTPETKAKLHLKIAAERIIEVKMMLEAKDISAAGLDIALANITQNIEGAKGVLKSEKNKGTPVEKLAVELNQTLDEEQGALRKIIKVSDESIKLKIKAVERKIKQEELEIEDELPEDELESEIKKELEQDIEDEVEDASESARKVERLLEKLNKEANRSAQKALKKREEALKKAIEAQNKELERQQESQNKVEEKKQEELRGIQEKAAEEARKAAKEAQKAAEKLKEAQEKASEIRQAGEEKD